MILQSRVIRVLNLWQKNEVFTADIIQPLFDLANPSSELHRSVEDQIKRGLKDSSLPKAGSIQVVSNSQNDPDLDANEQQILSTIQQFLRNHIPNDSGVKFNKKLLDFDYSDDEDQGQNDFSEPTPQMLEALSSILTNDRLLNKLKQMGEINQHHIQQLQQLLPQAQYHLQNQIEPDHHQDSSEMMIEDDIQIVDDRGGNSRRRSRSPRNDRKRSRSHRSRSRSRDRSSRSRRRSRSRDRDREDREKRREREKKGLPALKRGFLSGNF